MDTLRAARAGTVPYLGFCSPGLAGPELWTDCGLAAPVWRCSPKSARAAQSRAFLLSSALPSWPRLLPPPCKQSCSTFKFIRSSISLITAVFFPLALLPSVFSSSNLSRKHELASSFSLQQTFGRLQRRKTQAVLLSPDEYMLVLIARKSAHSSDPGGRISFSF